MKSLDISNVLADDLPFRIRASFVPVYEYWQDLAEGPDIVKAAHAQAVLDSVSHATELFEPFDDVAIVDKYEKEIALLFAPLFPETLQNNEIKGLSWPFRLFFFNPTKRLQSILESAGEGFGIMARDLKQDDFYVMACIAILNANFGTNIELRKTFFITIPNKNTGVDRYYRVFINSDFVKIKERKGVSVNLTQEDIKLLIDNYDNVELWKEKIPPDSFDNVGFSLITMFDVTPEESLSSMKNILLKQGALTSEEQLKSLELHLRSYFNLSDLNLAFATVDRNFGKLCSVTDDNWWMNQGLDEKHVSSIAESFCSKSLDHVFKDKKNFVISDVDAIVGHGSRLIERMREKDVRCFIVSPLRYGEDVIGFLELTSSKPYVLNSVVASKLKDVTPLFTIALQRAVVERETQIEAIIQEEFTSIHPAVSWRFDEVAEKILDKRLRHQQEHVEDIVFRDVIPLYGQFDIRGSSEARNSAIRSDLIQQMDAAERVLDKARAVDSLPIYDQLKFRIQEWCRHLENGISAGDETKILEFLKAEIFPVFSHLKAKNEKLEVEIDKYLALIDPAHEMIYDKRKNYEKSVTAINDAIAEVIEEHQLVAQKMFPHYFERYKTDGIEYNAYIGQSIVRDEVYNEMYMRNLRLWQLILSHAVEMRMHELKPKLEIPLDIATLILVHSNPHAIKFRLDEMKFDVDGAYNIRYEIVKKRIDKARIKNTNERLTEPGKLCVVYSHDNEAQAYVRYFEYLRSLNMVAGETEFLELEDLQGTAGLKALRVNILYGYSDMDTSHLEAVMNQVLA
jgi:hypothetical protein